MWGCGQAAENFFGVSKAVGSMDVKHQTPEPCRTLGHAAPCWKGLKLGGFPECGLCPSPEGLPLSKQLQVVAVSALAAVPEVTPLVPGGNCVQ